MIENFGVLAVNAAVTLGAVYGGIKVSMNGLNKGQERIERKLDHIEDVAIDHGMRIIRLETKAGVHGPP